MVNVILISLPIAMVLGFGLAHVLKRKTVSMPDYAELPTPTAESGDKPQG